ncbi:uncharacterized protein LOC110852210 isoform X2 [Folsomia candida]|uniref:uncharacterized protein LOC110852210 isoform X2 n=1 Tax=Folsomia candida TaxID=158441 RepID=UPI000B8F8BC2|nr:uncharacterized protein LOC110852210 isoform X2 [Folsomia candida]
MAPPRRPATYGQPLALPKLANFKIRAATGQTYGSAIPGLEALHNETRKLSTSKMTWHEAFLSEFKISVDSTKYSVARVRNKGSAPRKKHNLMEDISILMSEFKRVLPLYTICITENNAETGAPVNGENKKSRNASTNVQEVGRPVFARIETRPDMDNFPNELRLGVGNIVTTKVCQVTTDLSGRRKRVPIRLSSITKKSGNTGPPTTTLEPKRRDSNYHNTNDLSQIVAPSSNSANTNTDYDNLFRLKDKGAARNYDDDAGSNISDDSQIGDLADVGIENENILQDFVSRAQTNYTNSQILQARHELRLLRSTKSQRWARWTLSAPLCSNILRDLLGI